MNKVSIERTLFRRIFRLIKEYRIKAPIIIKKQELLLIKESCDELLECYEKEENKILGE